jgi:hypothetical protein
MIRKKICLLGAFAVGKTSLFARFVKSLFSDEYITTVGVKVDKKTIRVGDREITLVVWDMAGEDEFQKAQMSYLSGASGYLLVADGTRGETLETARMLRQRVIETVGALPFILIVNKSDLAQEWEVDDRAIAECESQEWIVIKASAKTGEGVEEAFTALAEKISAASR